MSTERETTQMVRSWLQTDEHESAERLLGNVLDRLDAFPQRRPLWHAWRKPFLQGTFKFAAAALAVVLLAGVGFAIYVSRPGLLPAASPSPSGSPIATDPAALASPAATPSGRPTAGSSPTPSDTPIVTPTGVVAYPACTGGNQPTTCRIWVIDRDGTDAHELLTYEPLPGVPDFQNAPDDQYPLAWSSDGSQLLFSFSRREFAGSQDGIGTVHVGLALTDATGSEPEEFESLCPAEPAIETDQYNFCEVRLDHTAVVAFSPDGTRVAYPIFEDWGSGNSEVEATALAILDLSSGSVSRLPSTQTMNPVVVESELQSGEPLCATAESQGYNTSPEWSPDGTHLVFTRSEIGPAIGPTGDALCQNGLFTVDVISGELSQVTLSSELRFQSAHWSPDGSELLFHGSDPTADGLDVYTIRADGSDLRALTSDGSSMWPNWTLNRQIVFLRDVRGSGQDEIWLMNANGGNATRLDATIPALTAAGCVTCPNPLSAELFDSALWQPIPEDQR